MRLRKPKNLRIDVEPVTARAGAFGGNQHDHVVLKEALASKRAIQRLELVSLAFCTLRHLHVHTHGKLVENTLSGM